MVLHFSCYGIAIVINSIAIVILKYCNHHFMVLQMACYGIAVVQLSCYGIAIAM